MKNYQEESIQEIIPYDDLTAEVQKSLEYNIKIREVLQKLQNYLEFENPKKKDVCDELGLGSSVNDLLQFDTFGSSEVRSYSSDSVQFKISNKRRFFGRD